MGPIYFRYSEQDLIEANLAFHAASFSQPKARIWIGVAFAWFVLLAVMLSEAPMWQRVLGGVVLGAFVIGLTVIVSRVQLRRYARRNYAQQSNLSADWTAEWDETTLRTHSAQGSNVQAWGEMFAWLESDNLLLLFLSERLFLLVPKRALDADQAADIKRRLAVVPPFGGKKPA